MRQCDKLCLYASGKYRSSSCQIASPIRHFTRHLQEILHKLFESYLGKSITGTGATDYILELIPKSTPPWRKYLISVLITHFSENLIWKHLSVLTIFLIRITVNESISAGIKFSGWWLQSPQLQELFCGKTHIPIDFHEWSMSSSERNQSCIMPYNIANNEINVTVAALSKASAIFQVWLHYCYRRKRNASVNVCLRGVDDCVLW